LIFNTHTNVLDHIAKSQLNENNEIVDSYHIPEQLEGNVTGGIWIYSIDSKQTLINNFSQETENILSELKASDNIQLVMSKDDWDDQSVNVVLGINGLSFIEEIQDLEKIYQLGFRYGALDLSREHLNQFSFRTDKALTDKGFDLINRMNDLGMIIDVSQEDEKILKQIKQTTTKPLIASCSNCYTLTPHKNNLTDEQIKFIAETDGVIGITPTRNLLTEPTIESLVDHIDYLKKIIGIRHIALGLNFKNYLTNETSYLDECQNITQASNIIDELLKRNYNSSEVEAIATLNAKRVINKNLKD